MAAESAIGLPARQRSPNRGSLCDSRRRDQSRARLPAELAVSIAIIKDCDCCTARDGILVRVEASAERGTSVDELEEGCADRRDWLLVRRVTNANRPRVFRTRQRTARTRCSGAIDQLIWRPPVTVDRTLRSGTDASSPSPTSSAQSAVVWSGPSAVRIFHPHSRNLSRPS